MTPIELRAARKSLGLSTSQLADMLKLRENGARLVRRWESGDAQISGPAATAVELLLILDASQRTCPHPMAAQLCVQGR